MLDDLVLLPAMSHEYKKSQIGYAHWEPDELDRMVSEFVSYHVKGFKKGEDNGAASTTVKVSPSWRNKSYSKLLNDPSHSACQHWIEKGSSEQTFRLGIWS